MDEIWKRDEIDSPCVKVCVIHPKAGICVGCFRTLGEIEEWSTLSPKERATVREKLPNRMEKLVKRRGDRARKRSTR